MLVHGRTSGKWQACDIVTVDGNFRFQVTGACGERKFELTFEQLMQAMDAIDYKSMSPREHGIMQYFWADVDTSQVH